MRVGEENENFLFSLSRPRGTCYCSVQKTVRMANRKNSDFSLKICIFHHRFLYAVCVAHVERGKKTGPFRHLKRQHPLLDLPFEGHWPCVGRLSAAKAIGAKMRDP